MAEVYRIIGAEMSPYSVKVRSYFRYKAIPHQWILRNAASQAEFEKHAKMPIIPLVVTPDGTGLQDSTPIIDAMEKRFPVPSIHPDDAIANFVSALTEEFGDEWGNKWMFHYRWAREVDQISSAGRIARMRDPVADEEKPDDGEDIITREQVLALKRHLKGEHAKRVAALENSATIAKAGFVSGPALMREPPSRFLLLPMRADGNVDLLPAEHS